MLLDCLFQSLPLLKVELLQFQVFCAGLLVFIRLFLWQIKNLRRLLVLGVPVSICDPRQPGSLSVLLKEIWPGVVQGSGSNQPPNPLERGRSVHDSLSGRSSALPKPDCPSKSGS